MKPRLKWIFNYRTTFSTCPHFIFLCFDFSLYLLKAGLKIFLNFNIKLRIKLLQKYVFCPYRKYFFVLWDRNSFYLIDMERNLAKTFKTANIPTPGEVIWYAHHNPVMRWYEGCILWTYICPVKKGQVKMLKMLWILQFSA